MTTRERLVELERIHAEQVQIFQGAQVNCIKLEGAIEVLKAVVAEEEAEKPEPAKPVRRLRAAEKLPEQDAS